MACRDVWNTWPSGLRSIGVGDCRRCWLHLCKVTTVLYYIFLNGRAIIGFNHGLPWCVKYMALGPPVATKPSGFAVGFCGDRRPSCHVFHTSRQAMIKTYNTSRREGSKCARNVVRHVKLCGQLMQEEWFVAIKIIYVESSITINI